MQLRWENLSGFTYWQSAAGAELFKYVINSTCTAAYVVVTGDIGHIVFVKLIAGHTSHWEKTSTPGLDFA